MNPPPPSTVTTHPPKPRPFGTPLPLLFPPTLKSVRPVGRTPSGIVPLCTQRSHWPRTLCGRQEGGACGVSRGGTVDGGTNAATVFSTSLDGSGQRAVRWPGATQDGAAWRSHDLTDPLSLPRAPTLSFYTQPIVFRLRSRTTTEVSDGEQTACLLARRRGAQSRPVQGHRSEVS